MHAHTRLHACVRTYYRRSFLTLMHKLLPLLSWITTTHPVNIGIHVPFTIVIVKFLSFTNNPVLFLALQYVPKKNNKKKLFNFIIVRGPFRIEVCTSKKTYVQKYWPNTYYKWVVSYKIPLSRKSFLWYVYANSKCNWNVLSCMVKIWWWVSAELVLGV